MKKNGYLFLVEYGILQRIYKLTYQRVEGSEGMKRFCIYMMAIWILVLTACGSKPHGKPQNAQDNMDSHTADLLGKIEVVVPEQIAITISATGDVTMGNYLGQGYDNSFNQTYEKKSDPGYFFQNVKEIFEKDDLTLVNLEGVLTTSEDAAPGRDFSIKGKPEYVKILTQGGIDAVSMENNHRRDFGVQGTTDTVAALESEKIPYAYEENLGFYEVQGVKIGWVAVNHASFGSSVEPLLENGIRRLKEEGADLILACCHWGIERHNYPTDAQRALGRKCIDWGADLVIGHHPHVIQGFEEYQGKYIIHSLGNFCFGANKNPTDKDSMIFQQTFYFTKKNTKEGTEVELNQYGAAQMIPCSISSVTTRNDYCPTPLTGAEGQRVIDRVNTYSKDLGVYVDEEGVLHSK